MSQKVKCYITLVWSITMSSAVGIPEGFSSLQDGWVESSWRIWESRELFKESHLNSESLRSPLTPSDSQPTPQTSRTPCCSSSPASSSSSPDSPPPSASFPSPTAPGPFHTESASFATSSCLLKLKMSGVEGKESIFREATFRLLPHTTSQDPEDDDGVDDVKQPYRIHSQFFCAISTPFFRWINQLK